MYHVHSLHSYKPWLHFVGISSHWRSVSDAHSTGLAKQHNDHEALKDDLRGLRGGKHGHPMNFESSPNISTPDTYIQYLPIFDILNIMVNIGKYSIFHTWSIWYRNLSLKWWVTILRLGARHENFGLGSLSSWALRFVFIGPNSPPLDLSPGETELNTTKAKFESRWWGWKCNVWQQTWIEISLLIFVCMKPIHCCANGPFMMAQNGPCPRTILGHADSSGFQSCWWVLIMLVLVADVSDGGGVCWGGVGVCCKEANKELAELQKDRDPQMTEVFHSKSVEEFKAPNQL